MKQREYVTEEVRRGCKELKRGFARFYRRRPPLATAPPLENLYPAV